MAAAFVCLPSSEERKIVTVGVKRLGHFTPRPFDEGFTVVKRPLKADDLREESDNTRSETVVHAREICFDKY